MLLEIPGLGLKTTYKRYYPNGEATAQLVGITNIDQKGQEGIEYSYQKTLAGKSGSRRINKNKLKKMSQDGYEYVTKNHNWEILSKKMISLFELTIKENSKN